MAGKMHSHSIRAVPVYTEQAPRKTRSVGSALAVDRPRHTGNWPPRYHCPACELLLRVHTKSL